MKQEKPWRWTKEREVEINLSKDGPQTFRLVPMEPHRITELALDIQTSEEVTQVFVKALEKFESGQADYKGALRRVKDLREELQKALDEQLIVARGVAQMFEPAGVDREFGMYVNLLTKFAFEAIERGLKPPTDTDPPSPPKATEPPASDTPKKKSELAPAAPVAE